MPRRGAGNYFLRDLPKVWVFSRLNPQTDTGDRTTMDYPMRLGGKMKEKPALLALCRHCEKHKNDFEGCLVSVEPDEVIVNCKDFAVLKEE